MRARPPARRPGPPYRLREEDPLYPDELSYTAEHEWLRVIDAQPGDQPDVTVVRIGITAYAQESLGDIVFVTLPAVGDTTTAGQALGEVESTKSVSDVYAPLAGTVRAVNEALDATPELVNSDPYGEGWLLELAVDGGPQALQADTLLDRAAYQALLP